MKRLILTMGLLCMLTGVVISQNKQANRTPEERAKKQTEWMVKELGLTGEQLKKVESINLEYAKKMETVRAIEGKLKQYKKVTEILDEKDSMLKKILTEKQFSIYLEKKKELRAKAMDSNR